MDLERGMAREITVTEDIRLYIRDGTKNYSARIRLPDGKWKRISTGTSDENKAREQALHHYAEMKFRVSNNLVPDSRTVRHVCEQAKMEMQEALDAGSGKVIWRSYMFTIDKWIIPFFGNRPIDGLTYKDMKEWQDWKQAQWGRRMGYSTLRNHNSAMSQVFKCALLHGWMKDFQVPQQYNGGKAPEARNAFLDDDYTAIMQALSDAAGTGRKARSRVKREILECYVGVLCTSGLRPGIEMNTLRWCDYDPEWEAPDGSKHPELRVQAGKRGGRGVIVRAACRKWLTRMREISPPSKDTDLIFRYPDGEPIGDMNRTFQVVLKNAGLLIDHKGRKRTLYCCRHFYGTNILVFQPDIDPIFLAGAMGTSVAMLERYYADADPKRKASAFSGITRKPASLPGINIDSVVRKRKNIDF